MTWCCINKDRLVHFTLRHLVYVKATGLFAVRSEISVIITTNVVTNVIKHKFFMPHRYQRTTRSLYYVSMGQHLLSITCSALTKHVLCGSLDLCSLLDSGQSVWSLTSILCQGKLIRCKKMSVESTITKELWCFKVTIFSVILVNP